MTWILREVKTTGRGEISQRKCVEGEKKDGNGISEKPHVKGRENTQMWILKEKEKTSLSRWEHG